MQLVIIMDLIAKKKKQHQAYDARVKALKDSPNRDASTIPRSKLSVSRISTKKAIVNFN